MSTDKKIPGRITSAAAAWQASRIADPVNRLRFLRHTVGDRCAVSPAVLRESRFWRTNRWKIVAVAVVALAWPAIEVSRSAADLFTPVAAVLAKGLPAESRPNVWMLETQGGAEVWSNGLRIERRFEVPNEPRAYEAYPAGSISSPVPMSVPVGIVYHTTESHLAPLEEEQNHRLRVIGTTLLQLIRENKSYHYVIDRFGRVWRVVRESDSANHAGNSVWADPQYAYLNLNRSFLGISVETQTAAGGEETPATPAQVHALKVLTEMLRSKYSIQAANCVTHAQVSVNPSNRQVGYHYDWGAKFPYAAAGLPDNYAMPIPAIWLFGFTYDPSLVKVTGERYWQGLAKAEERMRQDATRSGMPPETYRKGLWQRYGELYSRVKNQAGSTAALESN